jgi:prevent-host-death family protein
MQRDFSQINIILIIQLSLASQTAMRIVNIHEAKTYLSKLVEAAAEGEPVIIAKAGRPMVKVVPLDQADSLEMKKLGFVKDTLHVPDELVETERAVMTAWPPLPVSRLLARA